MCGWLTPSRERRRRRPASAAAGQSHILVLQQLDGSLRTVTLMSEQVTKTPVQNVRTLDTTTGKVGYLLFNDHVATSESQLIAAMARLKADGVQDLVLDLRYNGGGLLDIASELAYMVAGPSRTAGAVFEKHPRRTCLWNFLCHINLADTPK